MRVGLQLPSFSWSGGPQAIAQRLDEIALSADEAGFYSLWVMDHLYQIPSWGTPERDPMLEAYVTLGHLAATTRRVKIGTLATSAFYRFPGLLLKAVTTLDVLSGGRAYLGVGAGWYEREARGLGIGFPERAERMARLEELLRITHHIWSGRTDRFVGTFSTLEQPIDNPRPLQQPRPPILVAGGGVTRTLRFVARYADACNVVTTPKEIGFFLDALKQHCDAVGRDYDAIEKTVLDAEDDRRATVPGYEWTPRFEIERLHEWSQHGVDHVIVNNSRIHEREVLQRFGEEVLPAVAHLGRSTHALAPPAPSSPRA